MNITRDSITEEELEFIANRRLELKKEVEELDLDDNPKKVGYIKRDLFLADDFYLDEREIIAGLREKNDYNYFIENAKEKISEKLIKELNDIFSVPTVKRGTKVLLYGYDFCDTIWRTDDGWEFLEDSPFIVDIRDATPEDYED